MPFVAINGHTISVADQSAVVSREPFGEDTSRAFSGRLQPSRRGVIRRFEIEVPLESYQDQLPLAGLISGEGHHWTFDSNLFFSYKSKTTILIFVPLDQSCVSYPPCFTESPKCL